MLKNLCKIKRDFDLSQFVCKENPKRGNKFKYIALKKKGIPGNTFTKPPRFRKRSTYSHEEAVAIRLVVATFTIRINL